MQNKFNDMQWHDAELLSIALDRSDPGNNDQVTLGIRWQNGEINKLVFEECYEFEAKMNFGVIALESILDASCSDDSQELRHIKEKWTNVGVDLANLNCFEIRTNSTSSILRIYALSYSFHNT